MGEQAKPAITKDDIELFKKQQAKECFEKVNKILAEYECKITVLLQLTEDGRVVGTPMIANK